MLHPRSVVVTGVGAVTPLGTSFDAIGDALLAGRSGVVEVDGDWRYAEYAQGGFIARGDALLDRTKLQRHGLADLSADQMAEGIGGKVSE